MRVVHGMASTVLLPVLVAFDLRDAARMPSARERRVEPGFQYRAPFIVADEARGKYEDIGVVVLARQRRDLRRPRNGSAHVRVPVGRVGHAEPSAAEQDASLTRATR